MTAAPTAGTFFKPKYFDVNSSNLPPDIRLTNLFFFLTSNENIIQDTIPKLLISSFKEYKNKQLNKTDKDALDIMDLKYDAKWEEIQKKFKIDLEIYKYNF